MLKNKSVDIFNIMSYKDIHYVLKTFNTNFSIKVCVVQKLSYLCTVIAKQ